LELMAGGGAAAGSVAGVAMQMQRAAEQSSRR
jgi:hypothetical protein